VIDMQNGRRTLLRAACAVPIVAAPGLAAAQLVVQKPVVLKRDDNYRQISPQPVARPDKIEVIDFFFYGCQYCNELQPMLEKWRASLPDDVVFRHMPVVRHDSWAPLARTFFTLEALGELERLHLECYKGYHVEELHMSKPDVMADWARRHGIDRKRWLDTYNSDEVTKKLADARRATKAYDIQGTPSIVVDGRYLTSSGMTDSVATVTPVADLLVKLAREQRRK